MNDQIKEFIPKDASPENWERYFEFVQKFNQELFPNDKSPDLENIKKGMLNPMLQYDTRYYYIMENEQSFAGVISIFWDTEQSPDYEKNKNIADLKLRVLQRCRRKGIGRKLFNFGMEQFKKNDRFKIVHTEAINDEGNQFAEKSGGTRGLESAINRLYLCDVNWDMVEMWNRDGNKHVQDVKIETFNKVSDSDIESFTKLYTEASRMMPWGDIEGDWTITVKSCREREKRLEKLDTVSTSMITREKNGDMSGLTETTYCHKDPDYIYQEMTGVTPKYRGRGLGKWLKAKMLLYIREHYPNVKYIETENADSNGPMLAINEKLGFKRVLSSITYKFRL